MGLPAFAETPKAPGIHNFRQVDEQVYRGAQPTNAGFKYLATLGVRVVLDLREHDERSSAEEKMVTAAGMRYVNVPMTGLTPPTEAEARKVLSLLEGPGPVFVHCKRGADRTGSVIAAYRIHHQGWDNAKALKEANEDGMGFRQTPRRDFIRTFQWAHTDGEFDNISASTAAATATHN
jgi:protein tyrosine/serine phosphatase